MKKMPVFLVSAVLIVFVLNTTNVNAQLNTAGTYVWNVADEPKIFNNKLQLSFVSSTQGFPSYGTVLAGGGYTNSQDGAVFQMYFPYNPAYGGIAPQIRFGKYNNQGWSSWSTFFTSANSNIPTVDWVTKDLIAYGNVLIGKTSQSNTSYKLDINGNARANKIVVNTTGADYVFDSLYHILPLDSLNAFIHLNHHLPGIPSAKQMEKEGLDVGDNQMVLLQKIEELTLIVIDQNKRAEAQQKLLELQNERIAKLENLIKN